MTAPDFVKVVRIDASPATLAQALVLAKRDIWVKATEHYFDATAEMDVKEYVEKFRADALDRLEPWTDAPVLQGGK